LANDPAARADTEPDVNPFEDLLGSTGFNSWTPAADAALPATLAASMDQSVDSFLRFSYETDPFTDLLLAVDPTAFSGDPDLGGGFPVNAIGDLAVGLDWMLSSGPLAGDIAIIFDLLDPNLP
jgi:hypothetical protein